MEPVFQCVGENNKTKKYINSMLDSDKYQKEKYKVQEGNNFKVIFQKMSKQAVLIFGRNYSRQRDQQVKKKTKKPRHKRKGKARSPGWLTHSEQSRVGNG